MTQTFRTPNVTEIVNCPCGKNGFAFKDSYDEFEVAICGTCGMMTTSKYLDDSEQVATIKKLSPPEIWNLSILDENNFRWFPSVLQGDKNKFVYAMPVSPSDSGSYRWAITPIVKVMEAEQYMYTNPETGVPYEYRLAEEQSEVYDKNEFEMILEKLNTPDSIRLLNRIRELRDFIKK